MWSRRHFLETLSAVPLIGGAIGGRVALATPAVAAGVAGTTAGRDYFKELGVRPFINAAGTYTIMTASLMLPEVMEAINAASKQFVMLDELHDRVGERIASLLKCESAMVTAGASSALTLATAGVLTGLDTKKMDALPDLTGMKNEVIIKKAHRFGYDHAVRACGVKLVEVESRDDLERAVNDKTAMMMFYNNNNSLGQIKDAEFAQLAKKHNIPTLIDCAADVPPVENFWKYTQLGFDLVAFSGGKGIRGPQSAGMLLGRKDLIAAARLNAPPRDGIGRGMKVNKEEMVGMLAAVEHFLKQDFAAVNRDYENRANAIVKSATSVAGVKAEMFVPEIANHVPHVRVTFDKPSKEHAEAIVKAMRDGEPSIAIRNENDVLVIGVWMLRPGEDAIVAKRLHQVLTAPA